MAKVHNLDLYAHTGDSSCLGCVDAPPDDAAGLGGEAASDPAETSASDGAGSGAGEPAGSDGADQGETTPATETVLPGQAHLIEVQVVDVAGVPRSEVLYELRLPDGSTRTGATSGDGFIRLSVAPHTGEFTLWLRDFERPGTGGDAGAGGAFPESDDQPASDG